ncbi:methyltransferase domain-containing protein [Embleya sp. NPDC020630]|uniref:methyltransferase domain-containing protein n=1 Tax=Embleya sp. NPDC020630 TaxID=3363979 RepID=UPI00378EC173
MSVHDPLERSSRLADTVAASVPDLDPRWREAIATVRRDLFLPDRVWTDTGPVDRSTDEKAWWETAYDDIPVITAMDRAPGREDWPTSSASQPSVVAAMLDLLDPTTGPFLEIGTGTGWNACLLQAATGHEVVSVEIDPDLARAARAACERAGIHPHIVTGDGTLAHPARAPYAAVVATCSVNTVPAAWVEQTRPGGTLLLPWISPWVSYGIARLTRDDDGGATGPFAALGSFMPLRAAAAGYDDDPPPVDHGAPTRERVSDLAPWAVQPEEPEAAFVVGATLPGHRFLTARADGPQPGEWCCTLRVIDATGANWADVDHTRGEDQGPFPVTVHGERDVWADIEDTHDRWTALGRPGPERFGLRVEPDGGQHVWFEDPSGPTWPLSGTDRHAMTA